MNNLLSHLLDISPYRAINKKPFKILKYFKCNNEKYNIIFYSKKSENWSSLKFINLKLVGEIIKGQELDVPTYIIDIDDPELEMYSNVFNNISKIYFIAINQKVLDIAAEKRKLNPKIEFNIFHIVSSRSMGFQYKFFGLNKLSKTDRFICLCEGDENLLKKFFPENRITKYNPVSFEKEKITFSKAKNLIYVGRISQEKNIHWSIAALAYYKYKLNLKPPVLHVYGEEDYISRKIDGRSTYREFLDRLIKEFDLAESIKFHGYKPQEVVLKEIASMDVQSLYLSTYHTENYGLAVRELLKAGKKAIVSGWGGHLDLIDEIQDDNIVKKINVYQTDGSIWFDLDELLDLIQSNEKSPVYESIISSQGKRCIFSGPCSDYDAIDPRLVAGYIAQSDKDRMQVFFSSYGALNNSEKSDEKVILPFIKFTKEMNIISLDNNQIVFKDNQSETKEFEVSDLNGENYKITKSTVEFLKSNRLFV